MHNIEFGVEGSVAALLERWTCYPEDPSSNPTSTATYMWSRLKNRQLINLQPVGIVNHVLFQLNYVSLSLKVMLHGTIINNSFERNTALQHLLRHCFKWLQHCPNIATRCCAENRCCEWSRATSLQKGPVGEEITGSLSNDDGDGNENGKKAIGLDWENNNFARASRFLYISLPSLHDYNVKVPNFTFCRGRENKTTTFFFFS